MPGGAIRELVVDAILLSFDEAFISSSGIGIIECYWEGWNSNYKLTKKLKKTLAEKLTN